MILSVSRTDIIRTAVRAEELRVSDKTVRYSDERFTVGRLSSCY